MMKRILCILLCLALPLSALGAVRMPEMRGNINDAADVLSASTVADLAEFSQLVMQETDLGLHVATVHFLDGMEAQIYAEQLFQKWELTDQDMLLVCAAGEDSFALCLGEYAEMQLGRSNADNLLYTSSEFGQLFSSQQYDAAMAAYAAGLNTLLEKQLGSSVRMKGLFGEQSLVSGDTLNVDEYLSKVHIPPWQDVLEAINEVGEEFQTHYYEAELEEKWRDRRRMDRAGHSGGDPAAPEQT